MIKILPIVEKSLGHFKHTTKIIVNIDKTKHAEIRQGRHAQYISDDEIKKTVDKSIKTILKMLLFNKLNIGDFVNVHDISSNLNVIGQLIDDGNNTLRYEIITVMLKSDFHAKSNTTVINIK